MPELQLEPYFVSLIAALAPAIAYVLVEVLKKITDKVPTALMPMIPPIIGLGLGYINGFVADAPSALIAAAWGGLATVVYEIQKHFTKKATGG
jgi:hypothetical protein